MFILWISCVNVVHKNLTGGNKMDDDAKKVALRMIPYGIYVMISKDGDSFMS